MPEILRVVLFLTTWMMLFVSTPPAFAYIDPGSGGMMMQLLLGGVAGVTVLIRLYWQRLTIFLGIRKADARAPDRIDG